MSATTWLAINLVFCTTIAWAVILFCRECLRGLIAILVEFRVFTIEWGVGRRLKTTSIGPVELSIAVIPFGGRVVAASGSPKHHRLRRLTIAVGPALIQLAISYFRPGISLPMVEVLQSDFAPIATLHIANILLLALHGLIPWTFGNGARTDCRLALDILFARPDAHRHSRANYYARYARTWLERADVARANRLIELGLVQLGRDPLLVHCETRLMTDDLSSVIDQNRCVESLRQIIDEAESLRQQNDRTRPTIARLRDTLISAVPVAMMTAALGAHYSDQIAQHLHQRWIDENRAIADDGLAPACDDRLLRTSRWMPIVDRLTTTKPDQLRDRHHQIGRLERCRGDSDAAKESQAAAIAAGERARIEVLREINSNSTRWLHNEIQHADTLSESADLEREQSQYRLALATLGRAETQINLAITRGAILDESHDRSFINASLTAQKAHIDQLRRDVLAQMVAH